MSDNINEAIEELQELIRTATSLVAAGTPHEDLQWLLDRNMAKKHLEDNPKCWIAIKRGESNFFLPVCNRTAMVDPKVIAFSLKVTDKMHNDMQGVDLDEIEKIKAKLKAMMSRYGKEEPTPPLQAYRKGKVTQFFNKLRTDLDSIKTK